MKRTAVCCVRVDADAKKGFYKYCDETGLSPADVINMFMRGVVRDGCLPFEIAEANDEPPPENLIRDETSDPYCQLLSKMYESRKPPILPERQHASCGAFDMDGLVSRMKAMRK